MDERKESKKGTLAGKYKFVTFALDRVKLSTVHRKKEQRDGKEGQRKDTKGRGTRGHHHAHT